MEKLAEILHELIGAVHGNRGMTPDRAGELHALVDDIAAALPAGPEKTAAEVVADVTELALAPNGTLNANLPPKTDGAPAA